MLLVYFSIKKLIIERTEKKYGSIYNSFNQERNLIAKIKIKQLEHNILKTIFKSKKYLE